MKYNVNKAVIAALLLSTSQSFIDCKPLAAKHGQLSQSTTLLDAKSQSLQQKIDEDSKTVKLFEEKLMNAKVQLETDETMLLRHQKELEKEEKETQQLQQQVGAHAQVAENLAKQQVANSKNKEALRQKAKNVQKHEESIRKKIEEKTRDRLQKEALQAKQQGQIEAKDDEKMIEQLKLQAIKLAEKEERDQQQRKEMEEKKKQMQAAAQVEGEDSTQQAFPEVQKSGKMTEERKKKVNEMFQNFQNEEKKNQPKQENAQAATPMAPSIAQKKSVNQSGSRNMYDTGDEFKNLKELDNFGAEEDKAFNSQLDGEELVKIAGPNLKQEISADVKSITPDWLNNKKFFKNKSGIGKDSLIGIEGI